MTLQKLTHTNIIICLPTFRYSKYMTLFNRRIEMFNSLLFSDNTKYEYAYILDSNRNLKYTSEMFVGSQGILKNICYRIIFSDLNKLIEKVSNHYMLCNYEPLDDQNKSPSTESIEKAEKFFRP